MTKQIEHFQYTPTKQQKSIVLLCDTLVSPANIGAIFRLADAFGVKELLFNQYIDLSSERLKRTARNTYKTVPFRQINDISKEIVNFHENGYTSIALELTQKSIPLSRAETNTNDKFLVIIGNERSGITESVLNQAQEHVHIAMYGQNSSMNVAQATAIALYQICNL